MLSDEFKRQMVHDHLTPTKPIWPCSACIEVTNWGDRKPQYVCGRGCVIAATGAVSGMDHGRGSGYATVMKI